MALSHTESEQNDTKNSYDFSNSQQEILENLDLHKAQRPETHSSPNAVFKTLEPKNDFSFKKAWANTKWFLWTFIGWPLWTLTRFIIVVLLAIISPIIALISSLYSLGKLIFSKDNAESALSMKLRLMEIILDAANFLAIAAGFTMMALTISNTLENYIHGIFDQTKTSLHATFTAGSQLAAYVALLQAFSMLYDFFDNIKMLMKIQTAFKGTIYALNTSTAVALWGANIVTGLAIGADIALSVAGLVGKNSHHLLHFIPGLTVAIQAMNILIDITQTLLFIYKLNKLIKSINSLKSQQFDDEASISLSAEQEELCNDLNINTLTLKQGKLLNVVTDQCYALALRTAAKVLLLAACIIATVLNPVLGAIVTLGAVLIAQGLKQESKNTQLEMVKQKGSVFYRQGSARQTMYNGITNRCVKGFDQDEFIIDNDSTIGPT